MYLYFPPPPFLDEHAYVSLNLFFSSDAFSTLKCIEFNFKRRQGIAVNMLPNESLIKKSLDDYFLGKALTLTLSHVLHSKTPFQNQVLTALQTIPYGEQRTYGELAKLIDTHPRAIGQALKSNPLPLVYPCHRIVSQKGLGGFIGKNGGAACAFKYALLQLEQSMVLYN